MVLEHIGGTRAGEISASVEAAIRGGGLAPGESLPPVRRLADHLGVSPATVAAAYRDLQIRGLVTASGRRGTRVSPRPPVSHRSPAVVPAGVRNLVDGNPDPAFLPDFGPALARLWPERRLYGDPATHPGLVALGAGLFATDGISPDFVLAVGGALDGIERALAAHLRPGDRVAVEDPGYPAVFDLLLALGLVPHPLPLDDRGILPDELEAALRGQVAALIVTPRAQNPTGAALDEPRAVELREVLAERPDVLVIEDDHAGPVAGAAARTLCQPGVADRWAVIRSFSKSLGPDLRLALMAGDPVTISRVEGRQQLGAGWVSHVLQGLALTLWEDPEVQRLMAAAAAAYGERRRALLDALAAHDVPARGRSGMNVWVPVADEQAALGRLLDAGWAAGAGQRFRLRSGTAVRLSIGALSVEEAPAVAAALAARSLRAARTRTA
ncbi:MAG TPA: aminotransferase class I/II-fold pyridoxal phosphate-dependent enzyme [Candidatus Dormibacteraeota bacterium]|nr:aminotransferase class I/II-fold pyridoxal phosphate-dependent enzyme [Candidatus Dormibacteraeota bacterium]